MGPIKENLFRWGSDTRQLELSLLPSLDTNVFSSKVRILGFEAKSESTCDVFGMGAGEAA